MEEFLTDRKETRYSLKVPLMFAPAIASPDNKENVINTESIDMSLSGFQIDMDKPLAVGTFIDMIFENSGKKETVAGEVRWCKQAEEGHYHIGIALITPDGKKINGNLIQDKTGHKAD